MANGAISSGLGAADRGTVAAAVPIVIALIGASGYFIHAQTRLDFGPLRAVLADSACHRVRHAPRSEDFNRNFVSFYPVWDRLFGAQRMPRAAEAGGAGMAERPRGLTLRDYFLDIGAVARGVAEKSKGGSRTRPLDIAEDRQGPR